MKYPDVEEFGFLKDYPLECDSDVRKRIIRKLALVQLSSKDAEVLLSGRVVYVYANLPNNKKVGPIMLSKL